MVHLVHKGLILVHLVPKGLILVHLVPKGLIHYKGFCGYLAELLLWFGGEDFVGGGEGVESVLPLQEGGSDVAEPPEQLVGIGGRGHAGGICGHIYRKIATPSTKKIVIGIYQYLL